MNAVLNLSAGDLGSLLCSRVCHDVISPVGAINNGLELMEDEDAREDAMALIRMSAVNASARLQFARIAFGAAGSAGVQIDTGDAQSVATAYMANEKADFEWTGARLLLPKNQVKLLLNLILIAIATIPRGGKITVNVDSLGESGIFTLVATGKMVRAPEKFLALNSGQRLDDPIDAHSVQYYYTALLADESGMKVDLLATGEEITIKAQ